MRKPRSVHNEWFQCLARKVCACGTKKTEIWGLYNYVRAKKRLVSYFCIFCIYANVRDLLKQHQNDCGCRYNFVIQSPWVGRDNPIWAKLVEIEKELNDNVSEIEQPIRSGR